MQVLLVLRRPEHRASALGRAWAAPRDRVPLVLRTAVDWLAVAASQVQVQAEYREPVQAESPVRIMGRSSIGS